MQFIWSIWLLGCTNTIEPSDLEKNMVTKDTKPSVLLITVDTWRADRLGAYGDPLAQTPNIDALAKESVVFAEAHAVTPLTLPSHTSILTGLWPKNHGMRDNAGFRLPDTVHTLAEALSENGYATGAFVSAFVLSHAWGLDQGFDIYHDPFHPRDLLKVSGFGEAELPGNEVLNAARSWWKEQTKKRFAWVHLYDPHAPWTPDPSWKGDPYRGEIAKVDRWLGGFIQSVLEEEPNTLIILTSDHGENLWEWGEREHSVLLNRSVTRVPLIIRPPKGFARGAKLEEFTAEAPVLHVERPENIDTDLDLTPVDLHITAAKIVQEPVSLVDVSATIAEYVGVEFTSDGRSVWGLIHGKEEQSHTVYAETVFPYFHYGWSPLRMVQSSEFRLEQGIYDMYWMVSTETHVDISSLSSESQQKMQQYSAQALEIFGNDIVQPGPVDSSTASALQSLGYITDTMIDDLANRVDPRDRIDVLQRIHAVDSLDITDAIAELEKIAKEYPEILDAQVILAYMINLQGRPEDALQISMDILREHPQHTIALNNAVILSYQLKQYAQAEELAKHMLSLNAQDARAYRYLAAMYAEQERPQDVIIIAEKGIMVDPEDPNLRYLLGLAYNFTQQYEKSTTNLLLAKQFGSRANDIMLWVGISLEKQGNIDEAKKYYILANQDMPLDHRPNVLAGLMLANQDRCVEAKDFLLNVVKRIGTTEPMIQQAMERCHL